MIIVILLLAVLFVGEPDLWDKIHEWGVSNNIDLFQLNRYEIRDIIVEWIKSFNLG